MTHTTHRIEAANLHFGEALSHPESMELMFGSPSEPHHGDRPTAVLFQEVWPSNRVEAQNVAKQFGYEPVVPEASLDLFAAVRQGVALLRTAEHLITGKRLDAIKSATRPALRREAGIHAVTVGDTANEWQLCILNAHPVPPPLQLVTRKEIRATHDILEQHYPVPPDGTVNLLVRDGNHFPQPYKWDTARLWQLGYQALIPKGTPTCMVEKTHPNFSRIMRVMGIPNPQLDSAYIAVPDGYDLVHCHDTETVQTLNAKQIGYSLALGIIASDHIKYGISLHLPE